MSRLTEITDRLALYRTAETAILSGHQSYTIGAQSYTRANLQNIQAEIRRLESQLAQLQQGRLSHSQAVFGGRR